MNVATCLKSKPANGVRLADTPWRLSAHPSPMYGFPGYWLVTPAQADPTAPPLVAVHGILRDARGQARRFANAAAAAGRTVIAPLFDPRDFPGYQQVIMRSRADIAMLDLMDYLRRTGIIHGRRFDLFGYSGGAQFAHRFAMLHPNWIGRLSIASAGWFTFPDQTPYPCGLGKPERPSRAWSPYVGAGLTDFLRLPIRVCVGELDNSPDEHTRSAPAIDRQQGLDRLSRARNWTAALIRKSAALGLSADIRLHELPGCGHDFGDCVEKGGLADIVFRD